jgi:L,D-transpeptidase YbiS
VLLSTQRLELLEGDRMVAQYAVSTSAYGAGELVGTEKTPRGRHEIVQKIGGGMPGATAFMGREPTGEICRPELIKAQPGRDWILSRILWLRGLEEGFNLGGSVDTEGRYIYIP